MYFLLRLYSARVEDLWDLQPVHNEVCMFEKVQKVEKKYMTAHGQSRNCSHPECFQ